MRLLYRLVVYVYDKVYDDQRDIHVRTHACPGRRPSELPSSVYQRMRQRRKRWDYRFPYRVVGGYVRHLPPAGARLERASRGQPFDAIGMIAADAGDRVAGAARHADMAELAMPDPARGLAVNDQPDADPGPNRDIGEIVEPLQIGRAHV